MARRTRTPKAEVKVEETKAVVEEGINRHKFLHAMEKVKPGLANKEIIEQSNHFVFEPDRIWSYNDNVSVSQPFETGITGAISAPAFYKLISKLTGDTITFEMKDNQVFLTCDKTEASININPEITLSPIEPPGINSQKWLELPEDFTKATSFCLFSASKNMIKPELCCIWITTDDGAPVAISGDGFRATIYDMEEGAEGLDFLLPATAAIHLPKYNPYKVFVDEKKGWLHFINKEKTIFSCRTYPDKEFPSAVWNLFDIEGEEIKLPEGFASAIDRAQTLVAEDFDVDKFVTLTMHKNKIKCTGMGEMGWVKEHSKIDYEGEKIEIKVQPKFLADILSRLDTMTIGDDRMILFEGDNFAHVVALVVEK